ncbi:MAG: hypothetical protein AAF926_08780, partial [Pseudomonadota bacterium]
MLITWGGMEALRLSGPFHIIAMIGTFHDRRSSPVRSPMIWFFRALALSVATLILVLSLQPFIGPVSVNHGDKLQHFLAYGL